MNSTIELSKYKIRNVRARRLAPSPPPPPPARDEKIPHRRQIELITRLRLETAIYWLLKGIILGGMLSLASSYLGILAGTISVPIAIGLTIVIRTLVSFEIPQFNLMPTRKRRRNIKRFFKNELLFAFLLISIFFFFRLAVNPIYIGIYLLTNFIFQSVLYAVWYKYNYNRKTDYAAGNSRPDKSVIIVGASHRGKSAADLILKYPDLNVKILGFVDYHKKDLWRYRDLPLIGHPDQIEEIIACRQVDYVIMAVEAEDFSLSQQLFGQVEKMGVNICLLPDIYNANLSHCRSSSINGQSVLLYHTSHEHSSVRLFLKEIMDRVGAFFGLLIASPILLLSALAIKLETKGPIFFKQIRSGKNGKTFEMLKLRTMVANADRQKEKLAHLNEMSGPVFKIKNDPRITRVGSFLRKLSIDEFPQFINILKGEMSLVGPRPPLPKEVVNFKPWQRRKLSVKPGATCLWQINGRNHVDFDKWMELDLEYIDNWSLREDARILLMTFPAVLKGNGAS
jgi:exopolysaccharide biosynthesis polyprenyl glycosylphosphotransferase